MRAMERVFVDTNTLVSGLLWGKGNEAALLEHALAGGVRLLISPRVLFEARNVFADKFAHRMRVLEDFVSHGDYELLREPTESAVEVARGIIRHADDAIILASALIARPDYVISGNKHFHTDAVRAAVPVIRCAEFLEKLQTEE